MGDRQNSEADKETELTMCDVLEEEKELEDDANAVLGGSDDKNCSYDQGYVPRQALYACKSCSVDDSAGICLACCYACHDGHEVVELYTKRNFRCDCGNSKFTNSECTLNPNKEAINSKNKYNQNFKGLYCTCSRPYPDLEDSIPDEMIQCVVCEDWYHGRHLALEVPDDYFEMICGKCMDSQPFLSPYLSKYDPEIDVVGTTKCEENTRQLPADSVVKDYKNGHTAEKQILESEKEIPDLKCKGESVKTVVDLRNEPTTKNSELCSLKKLDKSKRKGGAAAFWPENWRKDLCRCSECMHMYGVAECEFLLNLDDTIRAYEERGKGGEESQYDQGLSALGQMDRVKQMEAIRAYTSMKGQLKEYLKEFADNKKTVRECDIKEFFERIGKKQKLNNGVPHFCR